VTIVVVGDVLLDADLSGHSHRLSPDAPVPVVDAPQIRYRAGGAGLAATMLQRDGRRVQLVTALSDDARSEQLREQLADVPLVSGASGAPTPTKTRVSASGHAIVRIDEGCEPAPPPTVTEQMIATIEAADAILVADYGRGVAAHPKIRAALLARGREVPLVWDPHPRGAEPVESAAVVTPNFDEAASASGIGGTGVDAAARAGAALRVRWGCLAVAVTLGEHGVLLSAVGSYPLVVSAPSVIPGDPCGAGDRLASSLVGQLVDGQSLEDAVARSVRDATAFLAAGGVGGMAVRSSPVPVGGVVDALRVARETKARGGTVVATGGCFDLLHAGHARTLSAARALGDCLIVCLNSDASVRRLKGQDRPIVEQGDRADLLASLQCVDAVLVFDEDTPEVAISQLQPDLWVKGGDYRESDLPEASLLSGWGGSVITVPYHLGRSTSRLATALANVG
jgi:rfaE bifunctional protein nucleotidyltransferase chain/domain/rfaE bifunctional protein kinase chain/domain